MINSFSLNEISMKQEKSIVVLCNKVNTVTTKKNFLLNVLCNGNLQYVLDRDLQQRHCITYSDTIIFFIFQIKIFEPLDVKPKKLKTQIVILYGAATIEFELSVYCIIRDRLAILDLPVNGTNGQA